MLSVAGVGCMSAGCLRLQDGAETQEPAENGSDTDGRIGGGNSEHAGDAVLSEHWRADSGIDRIWQDGETFYFNGYNSASKALHGSGVQWEAAVEHDGVVDNLGADAFATDGQRTVFGYTPDPGDNDVSTGHFQAFDDATGERVWQSGAPLDGRYDYAAGAAIVDGVAVLAASGHGDQSEQEPAVWGLDAGTGEELWWIDGGTFSGTFLTYVDSYGGEVYVSTTASGTWVLDPESGSVTDTHGSWNVSRPFDHASGRIHGETLFAASGGLSAHPIGDGGPEWSNDDIEEITTTPAIDTTLVVVGTMSGAVHAFERESGEKRWEATVPGTVWSVATSALRVWVADRETGLRAYAREDGTVLHQSTQPIERSDIAVIDDVILFGGNEAQAHHIRGA